jgi:hypothetical protein
MNRRFLILSVAGSTFLLTLAVTSWNSGLWQSDPVEQTDHTVRGPLVLADQTQAPMRPFAPTTTSRDRSDPATVSTVPPPAPAVPAPGVPAPPEYPLDSSAAPPPEMTESLLESGPGVDNTDVLARRDRARSERRNAESH